MAQITRMYLFSCSVSQKLACSGLVLFSAMLESVSNETESVSLLFRVCDYRKHQSFFVSMIEPVNLNMDSMLHFQ